MIAPLGNMDRGSIRNNLSHILHPHVKAFLLKQSRMPSPVSVQSESLALDLRISYRSRAGLAHLTQP
jgi:hypothetical protein